MNDPAWALHEEAVHQALARSGAADPGEALCALLWLLRDSHRVAAKAFAARAFREGFELPDPGAATVAEGIRDLAAGTAGRHGRDKANDVGGPGPGMSIVADLLREMIPLWDFGSSEGAGGPS